METYRSIRLLGRGGMAETHEAVLVDADEGPHVCIKRMLAPEQDLVALAHEAAMASRLDHRNVVRLFGHRVVRLLGVDGEAVRPSLIYELVEGISLDELLGAAGERLPSNVVAHVGVELAAALDHAHRAGVLHRDVSPSNVLISKHGDVKLADFGIGKVLTTAYASQSDRFMGPVRFVAPEIFDHLATIDARTDLYSLGIVLHAAATGGHPYMNGSESVFEMLGRIQTGDRETVTEFHPEVDPALAAVIDGLTWVDPDRRCAAARAVGAELATAAVDGERHLRLFVRGIVAARARSKSSAAVHERARPVGVVAALAVAAIVVIGSASAAVVALGRHGTVPRRERPAAVESPAPRAQTAAGSARATPRDPVATPAPSIAEPEIDARLSEAAISVAPREPAANASRMTRLRVSVTSGAHVAIDGQYVGWAPIEQAVSVGRHRVRAWRGSLVRERAVVAHGGRIDVVRIEFSDP